ncbi:hypothetical protein [Micromonospora sp. NPDC047730]|uniref:hypothetical protein n=1 Tax=Micromonospora sp. NPDC047730 TaxID=3364253 RepID=UPI0037185237
MDEQQPEEPAKLDHQQLMNMLRDKAAEHGWSVDWSFKGDQYGNGDQEYQVWFTPTSST